MCSSQLPQNAGGDREMEDVCQLKNRTFLYSHSLKTMRISYSKQASITMSYRNEGKRTCI